MPQPIYRRLFVRSGPSGQTIVHPGLCSHGHRRPGTAFACKSNYGLSVSGARMLVMASDDRGVTFRTLNPQEHFELKLEIDHRKHQSRQRRRRRKNRSLFWTLWKLARMASGFF